MTRERINILRRIILTASILCFIAAVGYLLFHYLEQQSYHNTISEIRDIAYLPETEEADLFVTQEEPLVSDVETKKTATKKTQTVIDFPKLTSINPDVCAWLKIPETNIDYPVLYHAGESEFYLHKDLHQEYSSYGSLFFAQGCIPIQEDTALLVYGHHMKDGSMFAGLTKYQQKEYYSSHPYIHLYTPQYNYQYQIAAVILTDISEGNPDAFYSDRYIDMSDSATLQEFVQEIDRRKLYNTDVELLPGDSVLMLSTCEYSSPNGRLIIVAKQTAKK